jgi:hypothetical protein
MKLVIGCGLASALSGVKKGVTVGLAVFAAASVTDFDAILAKPLGLRASIAAAAAARPAAPAPMAAQVGA